MARKQRKARVEPQDSAGTRLARSTGRRRLKLAFPGVKVVRGRTSEAAAETPRNARCGKSPIVDPGMKSDVSFSRIGAFGHIRATGWIPLPIFLWEEDLAGRRMSSSIGLDRATLREVLLWAVLFLQIAAAVSARLLRRRAERRYRGAGSRRSGETDSGSPSCEGAGRDHRAGARPFRAARRLRPPRRPVDERDCAQHA
jgi:hypothetical protein